jgi:hypothetical protein
MEVLRSYHEFIREMRLPPKYFDRSCLQGQLRRILSFWIFRKGGYLITNLTNLKKRKWILSTKLLEIATSILAVMFTNTRGRSAFAYGGGHQFQRLQLPDFLYIYTYYSSSSVSIGKLLRDLIQFCPSSKPVTLYLSVWVSSTNVTKTLSNEHCAYYIIPHI